MDLGFRGEVADYYHQYRRGYPTEVIDNLVHAFGLSADDVVLDIGCGTGQLTLPLSKRVGAALGMDPEPDMLARARTAAREGGARNTVWLLGGDTDVALIHRLLGLARLGAVTVGQALHWMDRDTLFRAVAPMLRPGGGIAVVTNGKPLWLHDTAWSRALRESLSTWLGTRPTRTCGTDDASQRRYQESLAHAGFDVRTASVGYSDELSPEQIIGGVYSALPVDRLPTHEQRPVFAEMIHSALEPHRPFIEEVDVALLLGVTT